jgi:hypothetical protein
MNTYKNLPEFKKEQLRKFPAYISLLAATYHNHGMDEKEKQTAIEFTHVKSFEHEPMLSEFYADVEKDFEQTLVLLNDQLPKEKKARETAIQAELDKLERILTWLGPEYSQALHKSLESYREHVAHCHRNLFEYLIFPIPIKGLTY